MSNLQISERTKSNDGDWNGYSEYAAIDAFEMLTRDCGGNVIQAEKIMMEIIKNAKKEKLS